LKRLSPRELRRMQARMLSNLGLDLKELGIAEEVIIRLSDREIVIRNPSVVALNVDKERIFQIIGGEEEERTAEAVVGEAPAYEPSQDDVMLVMAQTGSSEHEARQALIETNGDLAKAILMLKSSKR